ncbi:MAG TPA: hypothetical protein VL068_03590 [Microthrixaceae bacterium]|nr:hypothetical protein [Microthrixaceae bacterium]
MPEQLLTEPIAPNDTDEELSSASSRIANGIGIYLDEIAVPDEDQQYIAGLASEAEDIASRFNLMQNLDAARDATDRTWQEGFASGTSHAFTEIVASYQERIVEQPKIDPDVAEEAGARVCTNMGRSLADLHFTDGWRLVHSVRGTSAREEVPAAKGYIDGMEYALKRALTSFRARVEDRATRALASEANDADARKRLVALLYIAVTEATIDQVRDVLGYEIADEVEELDNAHFVRCTFKADAPPLQITPRGAAEAYRLAREFEAAA